MDALIFGCTRLTNALTAALLEDGHHLTVLDRDADRLARLHQERPEAALAVLHAPEPLMQDYLHQGGIDRAGAFLALSGDDHANLLVSQIARHIYNIPQVFCRLSDPQLQQFYRDLGLEIIGPDTDSIARIRRQLHGGPAAAETE